jgi:hypothetical protein
MAPSKCQRVKSTEEWITSYKLKLQRLSAVLPSQTEKETISGLLTKLLVESRKQSVARFSELLEPSRPASQMANQHGIITVGISVEYKETKAQTARVDEILGHELHENTAASALALILTRRVGRRRRWRRVEHS